MPPAQLLFSEVEQECLRDRNAQEFVALYGHAHQLPRLTFLTCDTASALDAVRVRLVYICLKEFLKRVSILDQRMSHSCFSL